MNVNYKLVYELRDLEQAIFAAHQKVQAAEESVDAARVSYKQACAKAVDVEIGDLEFSDVACLAKGICSHVYHIRVRSPHGAPENKCIFCGCDNWSD